MSVFPLIVVSQRCSTKNPTSNCFSGPTGQRSSCPDLEDIMDPFMFTCESDSVTFLEACVETENLNISASVEEHKEMEMKGNIALVMPFYCFLLCTCGLLYVFTF